jgi:putative ABC transport system permease protein
MLDLDHWQEIWAALSKNRLRTLLTAFGVFWGILLLVLLLGSGNGLSNGALASMAGTAPNSVFLWGGRTSKPWAGLQAGRRIEFTDDDTTELRRRVRGIEAVAPRLQFGGFRGSGNVTRGQHTASFNVSGDVPEIQAVRALAVRAGRFVDALDVAERRKVAVIGERVQEVLFGHEDPIGGAIDIKGVRFQVIGIQRSRGTSDDQQEVAQSVVVPFTTFQQALGATGKVHWFALVAQDGVSGKQVEDAALALLRSRHKVAPGDRRGIGSFNMQDEYLKVQGLFTGIRTLMWIVGLGTLAAGAIGVSNILLIVVRERTGEIGIRRAVGATPWSIRGQILFESVLLTAIAGLLGLVAGIWLLELAGSLVPATADDGRPTMFLAPGISPAAAAGALGVLVLAGVVAGLLPAQRALSISTVEALRD